MSALQLVALLPLLSGLGSDDAGELAKEQAELVQTLDRTRGVAWEFVQATLGVMEKTDSDEYAGIHAFARDVREATKGIDSSKPRSEWPTLDVDKLVAHNPNFWRAVYEIAPSDPLLLLTHAGLLVTAGEMTRGLFVLQIGKWAPTWTADFLGVLDQLQVQANDVLKRGDAIVNRGIKLYDAGDRAAAKKEYESLLRLWPQCSFAHYELGLTVMTEKVDAARVKRESKSVQVNQSVPGIGEAAPHFRRARLHDPLRWEAYQGSDQTVLKGMQALAKDHDAVEKIRKTIGSGRNDKMPDSVLLGFAGAVQAAGAHEYALVARQVIVARRGRFDPSDHPFFCTSLRALAPSDETEAVLTKLAGAQLHMAQLSPRHEPVAEDSSLFAVAAMILYQNQDVLAKRIGKDVTPFTDYINSLRTAAQSHWKTLPKDDGRAMMLIVFVKPDGKAKFYFTIRGETLADETLDGLREKLSAVAPASVTDGPVVVGMLINLWGGGANPAKAGVPPADLLFPKDWQDAAKAVGEKLRIPISDSMLKLVWPD